MQVPTRLALLLLLLVAPDVRAADPLTDAFRAQALLGAGTWSRVLRIENSAWLSRYPRKVDALVFEFADVLWFYTPLEGTQSLSVYENHVVQDKADLGPLLRALEPGFLHFTIVPRPAGPPPLAPAATREAPLPNGCFIESIAAWPRRRVLDPAARRPRLLSFYDQDTATRDVHGHTVLAYDTPKGVIVFDAARPDSTFVFPAHLSADPLAVAQALDNRPVVRARELPLGPPPGEGIVAVPAARDRPHL